MWRQTTPERLALRRKIREETDLLLLELQQTLLADGLPDRLVGLIDQFDSAGSAATGDQQQAAAGRSSWHALKFSEATGTESSADYLSAEAGAGDFSTGFFSKVHATKWFPTMEPFPRIAGSQVAF
jgi:hypothetical protein